MKTLRLNLDWISTNSRDGKLKAVYAYSVVSFLTRGKGRCVKSDLIEQYSSFTGLSKRTAYTHLNLALDEGYLFEKKVAYRGADKPQTTIFTVSKTKLAAGYKKRTEKFSEFQLKSYKDFQARYIRLSHLYLQSAFRFCYSKMKRNFESLLHSGEISEYSFPSTIDKVGCSIRKVCEYTGIRYETVQKALKKVCIKTANLVCEFESYTSFLKSYSIDFFKSNPMYMFKRYGSKIVVLYKLGSTSAYDRHCRGGLHKPLTIDPFSSKSKFVATK